MGPRDFTGKGLLRLATGLLLVAGGGCGVTGETGEALFIVGNQWKPDTPIAVGSKFIVSATSNDLAKSKLQVESSNVAVFAPQSSGVSGGFAAVGPGTADFKALDSAKKEVDHLAYQAVAPAKLELSNWAERIVEGGALLPETFSVVAGGKFSVRVEAIDSQNRALQHAGLVSGVSSKESVLTATTSHGVDHELLAKSTGSANLDLSAGNLARQLKISVVDASAVADFDLSYAPLVIDLGSIDKADPAAAPRDSDKVSASQVYFAKIRAKDANGGKVFGVGGKWSVLSGDVQLVVFSQGVSEAQYFELKPGQKATLRVELAGKTKELSVVGP